MFGNKNKQYKMLKAYIYKNISIVEVLGFNREFTESIYKKIKDIPDINAEWIVNKDKYGYGSKDYEKTLVIRLERSK